MALLFFLHFPEIRHVIDEFIRFDAMYYIPLHDTTIPSIIKAAKIFAGYGD